MPAIEPPAMLDFRWGTDTLRLEVAADGEESILTLLDSFDEQGKAARDAAGWQVCLDALAEHLGGTVQTGVLGERWQRVHVRYVARLGPETATIGPPAGREGQGAVL